VAAIAACSSSSTTGTTITVGQIAQHYDAVAGQLLAAGGPSDMAIGQAIELFNGAVAAGQMPSSATVNSTSPRGWLGNVVNLVDSARTDSVQIISIWFTGNITATIQSFYVNGHFSSGTVIDSGLPPLPDSASNLTMSVSQTSVDTCAFTAITNTSSILPTYDPTGSTCSPAVVTFSGFMQGSKADTNYILVGLDSVSFFNQHVNGVRLQFNSAAAFPSAVAHALSVAKEQAALRATRARL
jgi:hypothetical protein